MTQSAQARAEYRADAVTPAQNADWEMKKRRPKVLPARKLG